MAAKGKVPNCLSELEFLGPAPPSIPGEQPFCPGAFWPEIRTLKAGSHRLSVPSGGHRY
jgi:hypothetical protein